MARPVVGITLDSEEPGGYSRFPWYAVRENYCGAVARAGGLPVPLPHEPDLAEAYLATLDALVITGGAFDVDPALFGDASRHEKVVTKDRRTAFELAITRGALERDLPVLGICGGQQLLNVVLGGTLIQHIPDEIPDALAHEQPNPRNEPGRSQNFQIPTLMNHLLGTRFKVVSGYKGGGEINLAIESGEVQGRANFYEGFVGAKPDWIRDRKLKFFFTLGPDIPALSHVPNLKSLMESEEQKRLLSLIDTTLQLGQAFFLPPGTPRARVDAMADAFAKMINDRDFLADAKKRKLVIEPRTRAENQAVVAEAYAVPPDIPGKLAAILGIDRRGKK